jgi:hypothetical protein
MKDRSSQQREYKKLHKDRLKIQSDIWNKNKGSEYVIWKSMKQRCLNPNSQAYTNYGDRGINISDNFLNYDYFLVYIKSLPNYGVKDYTLDRIDVNYGYVEGNLRWVDRHIQAVNRRKKSTNTTGYTGISIDKKTGKFKSYIGIRNKLKHLGYYESLEAAINIRNKYILENKLEEYKLQTYIEPPKNDQNE